MLYQIIARSNANGKAVFNRLFTNKMKAHKYGRMLWENEAHDVYIEFSEIDKDIDESYNTSDIEFS